MKIYSISEFLDGKIPRREDLSLALKEFEQECILPYLGTKVIGSFAYGSINRDDCTLASDIDYFILVRDQSHMHTIREATHKGLSKNVSFQTRVITQEHATLGIHGVDCSFQQHLALSVSRYGCKGENPLSFLADNHTSFQDALKNSLSGYLRRLTNGYTNHPQNELERLGFLKAIVERSPFML